ncbi:DNA glycosylase [Entophlyctis helioformis]|nr:DNA glycosylase [Entophlyctis helioformis]KAI8928226.1 DNA glycosylase [Entophlyctis helioformis]
MRLRRSKVKIEADEVEEVKVEEVKVEESAEIKVEQADDAERPLKKQRRSQRQLNYEQQPAVKTDDEAQQPSAKQPAEWLKVYSGIKAYRASTYAPVDDMGCERIADHDPSDPRLFRYQTLTALQLSSQTKDPVTAEAMANLKAHQPGGLTIDSVLAMDDKTLDGHISKVGFHNRKTMQQTAQVLKDQYGSDIPSTVEGLMSLPGIGPKMAYLAMQVAWKTSVGIGVDTHVHRISNRLGWVKKTKTPEHTRKELEEWLPREYWGEINHLLVGYGQTVCKPIGPMCSVCPVSHLCPKLGTKSSK